jgi:hypothetical protein
MILLSLFPFLNQVLDILIVSIPNNVITQMTQSEQILALALKKVKQKINWKGIIST